MRIPIARKVVVAALATMAVALLVAASSVLFLTNASSSPASGEITLEGVSADDLAENGIILAAPPPDYTPAMTAADATAAVARYNPDARVKQLVLARVLNDMAVPKTDRLLWVANLDVEGKLFRAHGAARSIPYLYSIVFVDPTSGVALGESSLAVMPGSPVPLQPPAPSE